MESGKEPLDIVKRFIAQLVFRAQLLVELPCCLEQCYPLPWKGVAGKKWGTMKWEMFAVLVQSFLYLIPCKVSGVIFPLLWDA